MLNILFIMFSTLEPSNNNKQVESSYNLWLTLQGKAHFETNVVPPNVITPSGKAYKYMCTNRCITRSPEQLLNPLYMAFKTNIKNVLSGMFLKPLLLRHQRLLSWLHTLLALYCIHDEEPQNLVSIVLCCN